MAAASPTPLSTTYDSFPRRPPSRQLFHCQQFRPNLKRGSPLSSISIVNAHPAPTKQYSIGDSSDDEVSVPPIKFSAEAKAILGDEASVIEASPPRNRVADPGPGDVVEDKPRRRYSPQPLMHVSQDRMRSPVVTRLGSPRIVRLSAGPVGSIGPKRPVSRSIERTTSAAQISEDWITPAPRPRILTSKSFSARFGSMSPEADKANLSKTAPANPEDIAGTRAAIEDLPSAVHETATQIESLSISRAKAEETGVHGSIRVKRVGKVAGRYLSGPARRGMKRRQSEEDQSPIQEDEASSAGAVHIAGSGEEVHDSDSGQEEARKFEKEFSHHPPERLQESHHVRFNRLASIITVDPIIRDASPLKPAAQLHPVLIKSKFTPSSDNLNGSSGKRLQPMFKVPPLPSLPSRYDQENEPPPTFKRNKNNNSALLEKALKPLETREPKMLAQTPGTLSPQRQALAPRSQNTPHRPAPPPPKMTILETATATAGAAASASKKKRNYISVNGKLFTRMDCIGKGGSCKVYRVMAENYKVFALKRVSFEDVDALAVRGYKGEIDLLRKLVDVDRVVRLFDFEVNDERQTLSVLMEMGESDLNRILTHRLGAENATFDISFTRYFWKEMLECVLAIHHHSIVHSDLKPANFLLVNGRLKLIDFGIANAIQDDTINVHREQHVGTPNYMSPEALIDSNAASGLPASVGKMMKIGRPSDVWSLGCILYQMVYSKPPFAHIQNQALRIMAIPNPTHVISFPPNGLGNTPLPTGLLRTMRKCLNRDPALRPTVEQLLGREDPFLYPDAAAAGTVPVGVELIARLQGNIIRHVREKGMPSEEELAGWPARFFGSIKAAVEEGRA
ncbi:Dual-specificity kinase, spindle pole body (SPB) duplication and spindle checkpoint function [Toensbergia leucococca]|nr:Dual-specificity kinase, spindle pole body (SPB) duplication and spindle checkpoint function [Toensbergia leucococca]